MRTFCGKNYRREISNYDIIKLLMLSSQSREFHKFSAQLIAAATKLTVFEEFFSQNFAFFRSFNFREKNKNFVKYERKFLHFFRKVFVRWKPQYPLKYRYTFYGNGSEYDFHFHSGKGSNSGIPDQSLINVVS